MHIEELIEILALLCSEIFNPTFPVTETIIVIPLILFVTVFTDTAKNEVILFSQIQC